MNRFILLLILLSCSSLSYAQDLRAELALARFESPDDGPYLETYLRLKGNSLEVKKSGDKGYSEVVISYEVKKLGNVVFQDAYKVKGPEFDLNKAPLDFIDQQRIPLKHGKHELTLTIQDALDTNARPVEIVQELTIPQKLFKPFISDIQLVDTYSKTTEKNMLSKVGFDLIPYTSNFYPAEKGELAFYFEIYNTDRKIGGEDEFLVNMFVENADNGSVVNNLRKFVKRKGASVVPVLHSFPIVDVESGNYNLVIEARDKKNEIIDRKTMFFQRSNDMEPVYYASKEELSQIEMREAELNASWVGKYNRPEELEEYLRCLHPISTQEEITYVNRKINFNDPVMMKRFMYNFWKQRDPDSPEQAFNEYWKQVEKVNESYTTNLRKGYDTDRGRVYLQYGPPNTISPNYFEPNTYPYEIWHYYTLEDHLTAPQSNRKFIFANIDQGTRDFRLIHSDAKNEITNARWHHDLHNRSSMSTNLDVEESGGHFGGRSKDFFEIHTDQLSFKSIEHFRG